MSMHVQRQLLKTPGVSFTKLCDAPYDRLTCQRSHELILLMNCYIALGFVARALPCVAPHCTQEPDVRTQRTNIFVKDLPGLTSLCELYSLKFVALY